MLWSYLNIDPISPHFWHSRHGPEGGAILASNLASISPVLKHNRHGLVLDSTTLFCSLFWSYLNIAPISPHSWHGRHGHESRAILASNLVSNSLFLKQNPHIQVLDLTTLFCSLLWSFLNITPIFPHSWHSRHGTERGAMLALNLISNSPQWTRYSFNSYNLLLYLALKLYKYNSYLLPLMTRQTRAWERRDACFKSCF